MPDLSAFTFTAENVETPPDAPAFAHDPGVRAWSCTIGHQGRTMVAPFYQGSAIVGPPTLGDVLDCICTDASYVENGDQDELVADMPYSKARPLVDAVERQTAELRDLLGDDFDAFVFPDADADPLADFR